jgi:predicted dehydrogenase
LKLEGGGGAEASVAGIAIPLDDIELPANIPAGPPANVASLYAQFAKDIREGTRVVPDFGHALGRHHLLKAIETASETGTVQTFGGSDL